MPNGQDPIDVLFNQLSTLAKSAGVQEYERVTSDPIHGMIGNTTKEFSEIMQGFIDSQGDVEKFRQFMMLKAFDLPDFISKMMRAGISTFFINMSKK